MRMMHLTPYALHVRAALLVFAALLAGCSEPLPGPASPAASITHIVVSGLPQTATVGQMLQLSALATWTSGAQTDVTGTATWRASSDAGASISAGGLLTALAQGPLEVSATIGGVTGTASLSIQPPDVPATTYSVRGRVHETSPTLDVALGGTRIEVSGGSLDGRVFTADDGGRFELPPVSQPGFSLYFKRPGYEDVRASIIQLPRDGVLDMGMPPVRRNVTTSVSGSNSCQGIETVVYRRGSAQSGGWLYQRLFVHHDGVLRIHQQNFRTFASIGVGFSVYQLVPGADFPERAAGGMGAWQSDRTMPVIAGRIYEIVLSGDVNMCLPWSMTATYPS